MIIATIIIGIVMFGCVLVTWIKHRSILNAYKSTVTGFNQDMLNHIGTRQGDDSHQSKYLSALLYFLATQILQGTISFGGNRDQKHKISGFLYQLSYAMSDGELRASGFTVIGYNQALFIQQHPNVVPYILYRFFADGAELDARGLCADAIKNYREDRFLEFNQRYADSSLNRLFVGGAQPRYKEF